jgi:hypothetical protein
LTMRERKGATVGLSLCDKQAHGAIDACGRPF